jgi:hypothetical protein
MGFVNPQYTGMLESLGVELDGRKMLKLPKLPTAPT